MFEPLPIQYGAYHQVQSPTAVAPRVDPRLMAQIFGAVTNAANPNVIAGATPETGAPAGGSDLATIIGQHLANLDAQAPGRLAQQNAVLFGQHLGTGGAQITPANPTGNLSNPWASDGLFAGNAVSRAAAVERARPLEQSYGPTNDVFAQPQPTAAPVYKPPPLKPLHPDSYYLTQARAGAYARPQDVRRVRATAQPFALQ